MDSYRSSNQQDQEDSLGAIPVSLGSYHSPPPPPPNPIRVSAFSKLSSATSSLNILSPKDHHHHHHHRGTVVARNNGGSSATTTTSDQFMMTAPSTTAADHQDLIPVSISPSAAAATPNSTAAAVKYRECLRNHAASVGGHVLDGCCEFMPSDADPLKCAACDCHRSFHVEGTTSRRDRISLPPPLLLPPPPPPPHPTSALHIPHLSHYSHKQQQQHFAAFPPSPSGVVPGSSPMVAFGGNNSGSGATTESSSEERLDATTPQQQQNMVGSKKRFRTRFTPEQKEKMLSFAESVGWKIQRQDDGAVENFCRDIGVRRQVLRVWMHNNKHSIIRKQQQQPPPQLPQQIQPQQPADSALTPTSQPPAPPIFGHVRN